MKLKDLKKRNKIYISHMGLYKKARVIKNFPEKKKIVIRYIGFCIKANHVHAYTDEIFQLIADSE